MKTIFDCWFKKTKKKKKKTILDLPEDLVEDEIISRLPISSLSSVRSTCKKWNTLCKNRILFGKAANKQFLMMDSRRICLMNFDLSKDNGDPSIKQQLAVLYQRWEWESSETIEISVTDKIGPDDVSWTKFLKVNTGYWVYPTAGSFLVDEEKKIAVVFVLDKVSSGCLYKTAHVFGQDGYFKSVRIREAPYLQNMVCSSYLPSLVQLNQPG
ncbi:hypothetical protein YC2023_055490 [Brassica napus]